MINRKALHIIQFHLNQMISISALNSSENGGKARPKKSTSILGNKTGLAEEYKKLYCEFSKLKKIVDNIKGVWVRVCACYLFALTGCACGGCCCCCWWLLL